MGEFGLQGRGKTKGEILVELSHFLIARHRQGLSTVLVVDEAQVLHSETMEEILYRFGELVALGCQPYPMVYDPKRKDLKAFQRWAVTGLYRAVPWKEYRDPRLGSDSHA